jgi:hypothetical protein
MNIKLLSAAPLALTPAICLVSAAQAAWQIPAKPGARAEIVFVEKDKTVFSLACGHNVVLSLKYPGKQRHGTADLTIRNSRSSVRVKGRIDADEDMFVAIWGGRSPDPVNLDRLMSILGSGERLTIAAKHGKYVLPGLDAKTLAKYNHNC